MATTSLNALPADGFYWAIGAATVGMTLSAQSYGRILGANDRICVGFIGAGGMGNSHLDAFNYLKDTESKSVTVSLS